MSSKYGNVALDLSVARDRAVIPATQANPVATVNAQLVPNAASIHFGQGGEPLRLVQGKDYRPCPPETDGVFISNVASSGFLILAVTYADGSILIYGQDESVAGAAQIVYGRANQAGSLNAGPIVQLRNPANSGKIITVSRVSCTSATNGNLYLAFQRNILSNNGGGVLTAGARRFLDRSLAPATPMGVLDDSGIVGVVNGSTFDNNFWTEYGLAPGAAANFPPANSYMSLIVGGGVNVPGEFLFTGQFFRLYPGWGAAVQHGVNGAGVQINASFYGTEGGA